jgi:hypothetical protein
MPGLIQPDQGDAADIGMGVPHPARMYDYYLGGKDNFEADRLAAEKAMAVVPDARGVARTNREFLSRVVRMMATDEIDQFIDLGSGFPTSPNVHEVAAEVRSDVRVVYVDNDPVVVSHNRALRRAQGVVACYGDVRHPTEILGDSELTQVIDFQRPVGVLLVAVLHFVTDADRPHDIIEAFCSKLAPGSFLAISHLTSDETPDEVVSTTREAYKAATAPLVFRTRKDIRALFGDLPLVAPGLVEVSQWRPQPDTTHVTSTLRWLGGVARVP